MMIVERDSNQFTCVHRVGGDRPCLGKKCAAWRWGPLQDATPDDQTAMLGVAVGAPEKLCDGVRKFKPRKGYCGLAGKPSN